MSVLASPPKLRNLAELLDRLGGVPLDRVRLHPWPGTATAKDVVETDEREGRLCELIDGVLVEKTMGFQESNIAAMLIKVIANFVSEHDLGLVAGPDGMIRFPGDQVRMPDVAFISWDQLPGGEIPDEPVPEIVPDLAVEVLSRSNSPGEMSRKLREYFAAGVRLVWYVDPQARSVTVHVSPTKSKVVASDGTLDGGKVLPGFELPVREIFAVRKKPTAKNGRKKR